MNAPNSLNSNPRIPWQRVARALSPWLVLVAVLLGWQWFVTAREVPKFLLPSPWDIALAVWEDAERLRLASWRTLTEAACGLGVSLVGGFLIASLLSQTQWIRRSLMPYVLIFQTVPIIGVAPLLITWFGNTFSTVVLISAFISIFPVISNTTTGLISAEHSHVELFRLNRASRWQVFFHLQVPTSLPLFAAGARIAAAASVLGACVGDYFVGSAEQEGLGFLVFQAKDRDAGLMFATLLVLTVIGFLFYSLTQWLCRWLLLSWQELQLEDR